MPLRIVDAVPTRGEGDWAGAGLVDRVAATGLVSCMYVVVLVFEGFCLSNMYDIVCGRIGKLTAFQ